jgi:hypothetical protein
MNTPNTSQNAQDTLAKLLATENITVIRGNVSTASFDILNRRLLLPRWKEMTPAIEEMLMLHEVGHALFTTNEKYGVVFKEKKYLKDYANVIEDVRIERKMKERYPGSRKSFNIGYRELNERDFFGVSKQNLDTLLLIDKINLYFKVGFNCGVKFSPIEYTYIRKADLCKTEDDVLALAQEIFDFTKGQKQAELNDRPILEFEPELPSKYDYDDIDEDDEDKESSMYDNYETDQEDDQDEDDYKENSSGGGSYSKQPEYKQETEVKDEDLAPSTYQTFNDKVDQLADESLRIEYFECAFETTYDRKIIVPYKTCLENLTREIGEHKKQNIEKFKGTNSQVVSYLVKEFEMKKSATAYKRAKIAKLGQLDSNKLYAYKLKDDLFKQIMQVKDGKKHGMIFMLDWSGSMMDYIDETIEQVINLAMFCQRIQIPYQVFAFTDGYGIDITQEMLDNSVHNPKGVSTNINFNLLELFSHKMSNVEFNRMLECMLNRPYIRDRFGLNGTPLNEALLFMTDYVGKFIKANQVEKMTFITLTDGEGGQLYSYSNRITNGASYDNVTGKRIKIKSYMRDQVTKKDYELEANSADQTAMLLNIIRDRYQINSVAFFLMRPTYSNTQSFINHNFGTMNQNLAISLLDKISTDMRKQKYCILNNVPGRDEFYLLNAKVKIEDEDLVVNDTMNSSQLSRALGKVFNTKKSSRVVLNRFVEMVA